MGKKQEGLERYRTTGAPEPTVRCSARQIAGKPGAWGDLVMANLVVSPLVGLRATRVDRCQESQHYGAKVR
jgi:hypothetical protein